MPNKTVITSQDVWSSNNLVDGKDIWSYLKKELKASHYNIQDFYTIIDQHFSPEQGCYPNRCAPQEAFSMQEKTQLLCKIGETHTDSQLSLTVVLAILTIIFSLFQYSTGNYWFAICALIILALATCLYIFDGVQERKNNQLLEALYILNELACHEK